MNDDKTLETYKEQYRKWVKSNSFYAIVLQCKISLDVIKYPRLKAFLCPFYKMDMREVIETSKPSIPTPPPPR